MKLLDEYFSIQRQLFEYFGYEENWRVIPIDDCRGSLWSTDGTTVVRFADKIEDFATGNYYENEIYTQRHLPKWVYRGEEFTMIVVDTHTDGNKFLQIFNNKLELTHNETDRLVDEYWKQPED